MSGRDDTDADRAETPTHPERHEGAHLLGVEERGTPLYYDAESNTVYTGKVDSGRLARDWVDERLLGDTSLSAFLGEESSGWRSLSEYAKRHLPGLDADEDGDADGREEANGRDEADGRDGPAGGPGR